MSMTPPGPPPSGPPPSGPPPSGPPPSGSPEQQQSPGWIRLTVQGSRMTSNMIAPMVHLNGYPVDASYGENTWPVPPGTWRVEVHCQWLRRYGQARIDVGVAPGQAAHLYYATPWHQFTTGAIGWEKQKRRGAGFLVVLLLVIAVLAGLAGFAAASL